MARDASLHVVHVHWGEVRGVSFDSPPIGPFEGYTAARKAATQIRKRLRAAGRPYQNRVSVSRVASLATALGWDYADDGVEWD